MSLVSRRLVARALALAFVLWACAPAQTNALLIVDEKAEPVLKRALSSVRLDGFKVPNIFRFSVTQLAILLLQLRLQKDLKPSKSESLSLHHGDEIGLDWFFPVDKVPNAASTDPIVVYIAGITGTLKEGILFVQEVLARGWTAVVFHRVGHASDLKKAMFNLFGNAMDLRVAIEHMHRVFPNSPVALVGSSAGSALAVRYLGQFADDPQVIAGVGLSPGYSIDRLWQELTGSFFDRYLLSRLQEFFLHRHRALLEKRNPRVTRLMLEATTVYDFLKHSAYFSAEYKEEVVEEKGNDLETWLEETCPMLVAEKLKTPVLCLNALDDPICQRKFVEDLGYRFPHKNMNAALLVTEYGSHCAHQTFARGWWPHNWGHEVALQFIEGVLQARATGEQAL